MKKGRVVDTTTGSKKAAEPQRLNAGISPTKVKRTNFEMVAVGTCPHDNAELLPPARTKGEGAKAICSQCGHTWYINKKIRTCKCLTCSGIKEKAQEMELMERGGTKNFAYKNGGPLWSRTTDLSLIRNDKSLRKQTVEYTSIDRYSIANREADPCKYIDAWYSEQKLRSIVETTIYSYRQKVGALLNEYPSPNEFDIKRYLARKQEFGACSGTIANYVKAFRSFFGYLFDHSLYGFDPRRLKLPKVRNRERSVPSDEDIAKLLNAVESDEDKIAFLLLVDTGIRVQELATIKLPNINFNDASILIHGKGGKTRIVYLSETTVKHLRAYIQTLKGEYLFPSTRADAKSHYRNRTYFERRLRELCRQVSIEHITPHQLRHYFATYTLSRGGDVKAVSEMLGHADVGITLKIYHHVSTKAIRQVHEKYSPLRELETINSLV